MNSPNLLLAQANMIVRRPRPNTPSTLSYTTWTNPGEERLYRTIWFKTQGCRYDAAGECTECDFWISSIVTGDDMVSYVRAALETVNTVPELLMISPSGSMFDDWEVPPSARAEILAIVAKYPSRAFSCETRAEFVTSAAMAMYRMSTGDKSIGVEMGLESATPYVLQNCINKSTSLEQFEHANAVAHANGIYTVANVLIGHAFLAPIEAVEDAVASARWAFSHGSDWCVLFPTCVKQWTLVYWLWERGLYSCPSLWSLVEVLRRLGPDLAPKAYISWYRPQYDERDFGRLTQYPTTCPLCRSKVLPLLDEFRRTRDYSAVVALCEMQCQCKREWSKTLDRPVRLLPDRVREAYELVGRELLGPSRWGQIRAETLGHLN